MAEPDVGVLTQFHWECQPDAEGFVREKTDTILSRIPPAAEFSERLRNCAAVRFADMIDTIRLNPSDADLARLASTGWTRQTRYEDRLLLDNAKGLFPTVSLDDAAPTGGVEIHLKVESVSDFLSANAMQRDIVGRPLARYRIAEIYRRGGDSLAVVERHGWRGQATNNRPIPDDVLSAYESFRLRPREFGNEADGFRAISNLIDHAIEKIGRAYACDLWFAAEREYWMRRNLAGRVQKARQDEIGIGWANHDHHTYRSSRESFASLVAIWEKLGFHCRERFYAGREAGWGAQVMEDPITGITTFNDVDLSPEELMTDFSHEGLPPRDALGTVGLWCGLHGDAILQAGLHHLEAQFDFDLLRAQLERQHDIKTMKPFTNFTHLTQAFTEGERWPVNEVRIKRLLSRNAITVEQANQFRANGAIGSHLENLERNQGFKGFNQQGVSEIISATDPRKQNLQGVGA